MKNYYRLIKPGIVRGNAFTALAGFILASGRDTDVGQLILAVVGLSLVVASACVVNNFIDIDIDSKMSRTKKRALVTGDISVSKALVFAALLGLAGLMMLGYFNNTLSALLAAVGWVFYVVVYGYAKRQSHHGTLIGSISGSMPPVVGYTAASGQLDLVAGLFFIVLVAWQMPHFYAIAIYRKSDYKRAGIPVLPIAKSDRAAVLESNFYIVAFLAAAMLMIVYSSLGYIFAVVIALVGIYWLKISMQGLRLESGSKEMTAWSRRLFGSSLSVGAVLCVAIVIDSLML